MVSRLRISPMGRVMRRWVAAAGRCVSGQKDLRNPSAKAHTSRHGGCNLSCAFTVITLKWLRTHDR